VDIIRDPEGDSQMEEKSIFGVSGRKLSSLLRSASTLFAYNNNNNNK
jgi:hypothetical protein